MPVPWGSVGKEIGKTVGKDQTLSIVDDNEGVSPSSLAATLGKIKGLGGGLGALFYSGDAGDPKEDAKMAEMSRQYRDKTSKSQSKHAKGGTIMKSKSMKFAMGGDMPAPGGARPDPRMMAAMRAKQAARQQPMRRPPPGGMPPPAQPPMGMNKGGMAHGGMHKMPDGKMMKNSDMKMRGMKAGGMPMKDGKPAFMQKKMMGGGMAYAKGGGIESRGKTKGTVIRMAAGGSVSSRADSIAQRGKTKFTNY